jgi:two-component system nitrogen regulation sensor histidine kinase NtrY
MGKLLDKKRNKIIFLIILFVFIGGNLYIFKEISKVKDVFNPYIFLIIINIDVVFFLSILAISLRHLIKLFFEKSQPAGKLRKKLSLILIFMIVIPAMILSVASISLISDATNLWFSGKVEKALKNVEKITDENVKEYSKFLDGLVFLIEENRLTPFEAFKKFHLKSLVIFDKKNKKTKVVYGTPIIPLEDEDLLHEKKLIQDKGNLYLRYIVEGKKDIYLIDYPLPEALSKNRAEIKHISDVYSQFRYYKNPIRVSYILTMVIITMFVIFSALWFSQYVVRNLTYPLEELVKASKKLAQGDLNTKIKIKAPDELGILIQEFNYMVDELKNLYHQLERSNKDLKANKEYLEAILENARTGVIYSNRFGKIEKINKAAAEILNIEPSQLKGKDIEEFMKSIKLDTKNIHKEQTINLDGKIIIAKITRISPRGYVLIFDDITDVVAAEKILAWKEIAQRIAHEIKNPLTPIKLSAERIKRQFENNNPKFPQILDKAVNVIFTEVDHLAKLVKEFGQFASVGKGLNKERVNLKELLEELKESYQTDEFKIKLHVPDEIYIYGDKKLLRQAFLNLIQNSFEAVDKKGYVEIKAKKEGNKVIILFKDNGKGIPLDELDKVFIPYYSKKSKGSGLGLAITKEIVENHGGSIRALPSKEGALFKIDLPID